MHPSSNLSQGHVAYGLPRAGASLILLALGCWGITMLARTMPDIIRQIARPCPGCYLGAFGPPLEAYGHRFRQTEDVAPKRNVPPAAVTLFTNGGDAHWLAPRQMIGTGQTSLFGAPPISQNTAAFLTPDVGSMIPGVRAEGGDPGFAWTFSRFDPGTGSDGSINERPWMRDRWNTEQISSFPVSRLASEAISGAATLVDDASSGFGPAVGTSWVQGTTLYGRVAVQKDLERHFLQIGTYGLQARVIPGGSHVADTTDTFSGVAANANQQFMVNAGGPAHAAVTPGARSLDTSYRVLGSGGFGSFDGYLGDASGSVGDTITESNRYFRAAGSIDTIQYFWPGGHRNSASVITGVASIPWGRFETPVHFLNLRFAAQYVAHTEFNGTARNASANNALYLSLWGALRF